jgi:hypothetical protein
MIQNTKSVWSTQESTFTRIQIIAHRCGPGGLVSMTNTGKAAGADHTSIAFMFSPPHIEYYCPQAGEISQRQQIDPKSKRFASQSVGMSQMKADSGKGQSSLERSRNLEADQRPGGV